MERDIARSAAVVAGVVILVVAIIGMPLRRNLDAAVLAQRRVEDAADILIAIRAEAGRNLGAPFARRRAAGDVDQAGGRVLAVEDALRAAVDFHRAHIEHVQQLAGVVAEEHAVLNHADRRALGLFDVGIALTADEDGALRRTRRAHADEDVRGRALQVLQRMRRQGGQLLLGDRRQRDTDLLFVDRAARRRHGHDFDAVRRTGGRCPLSLGQSRRRQRHQARETDRRQCCGRNIRTVFLKLIRSLPSAR